MSFINEEAKMVIYNTVQVSQEQKQLNMLKRYERLLDKGLIKRNQKKYFNMLDEIRKEILLQGYDKNKSYIILSDYPNYKDIALVLLMLRDNIGSSYTFWSVEDLSEIWWGRKGSSNMSVPEEDIYESIEDVNEEVVILYQGEVVHSVKNYHLDDIVAAFFSRRMNAVQKRNGRNEVNYDIIKCTSYEFSNSFLYNSIYRLATDVTNQNLIGVIDLNGLLARVGYDRWYLDDKDGSKVSHIHDNSVLDYANPNGVYGDKDNFNKISLPPKSLPNVALSDVYGF